MTDWRQRASQLNKQLDEQTRVKKEREEAEKAAREAQRQQDAYNSALAILQKRFKCHICGKPASAPYDDRNIWTSSRFGDEDLIHRGTGLDWNIPSDLRKCRTCGKWTCDEHIHDEICKKCAETYSPSIM